MQKSFELFLRQRKFEISSISTKDGPNVIGQKGPMLTRETNQSESMRSMLNNFKANVKINDPYRFSELPYILYLNE